MSPEGSSTLTLNDSQADEDRMRAALGLSPERTQGARPAGQKPGRDAPFTVVAASRAEAADSARARLSALERDLRSERGERASAQQALADAQRMIQQLQTKLAHAEMAATEAVEAERRARLAAEAKLLEATPVPKLRDAPPAKRGRPPGRRVAAPDAPEQEPVQWWLPSYKTSKTRRAP